MSESSILREVNYGLDNLDKVYENLCYSMGLEIDLRVKRSAVAYECLGYYNAVEHLIVRLLKFAAIAIPSGASSHRDTLRLFESLAMEYNLIEYSATCRTIENLMAFRHVATKSYGFLINWNKLQFVVQEITQGHENVKQFIRSVLRSLGG